MTAPRTDDTLAVVRAVFAAFDAHDLGRFRALLADDAVLEVGATGRTLEGADAVVAAVAVTFDLIPDLRVTTTTAFAAGAWGVAEVVREGTHLGAVPLPDGTASPPTGNAVRLPECVVFEVCEGLVRTMRVWADEADTARQLGLRGP